MEVTMEMHEPHTAHKAILRTHSLVASDRIEGTPVRRSSGQKIGSIQRRMIDKVIWRSLHRLQSCRWAKKDPWKEECMRRVHEAISRAIALAVLMLSSVSAVAQTITFDSDKPGQVPKDFDLGLAGEGGPGRWQIISDKTAGNGRALAQLSTNTAANRFLVAIYNPTVFANGEITTRCKPISGRVDQACGLVIRAADARNYYIVRSNALERNVRFYRVRNGERHQLATAENITIPRGQWHTLTLRAEGSRYAVSLNGKALYTTTDTTTAEPRPTEGRAGLWVKSDSVTHFERVQIEKLL
jgi:hypothetical protein